MITIMSKYQPKYEHDAHHICFDPISRKELKDPVKQAEQKQYAEWVNEYNLNYDLFLQGKRSSEVLMSLDNLQDKINGENTDK